LKKQKRKVNIFIDFPLANGFSAKWDKVSYWAGVKDNHPDLQAKNYKSKD
jgi:hypothetical protein